MTAYTGTIVNLKDLIGASNWTLSASGTSEYYYNVEDLQDESDTVYEDDVEMASGTVGSLAAGECVFADNDSIGFTTIYVRLTDDTDPTTKAADFVQVNQFAHTLFLAFIKECLEAEGWVTQRYDVSDAENELIIVGPGTSGGDTIYAGFKTYQSVASDYYNMVVSCMKGYTAVNDYYNQPGILNVTTPCHNYSITYWLSVTGGRINAGLKVGTPVYEHFGVGNFLPNAPPNQWPQPMFLAGMFDGVSALRFSDTTQIMPWKGPMNAENFYIHKNDGLWYNGSNTDADKEIKIMRILPDTIRPVEDNYVALPLYIYDNDNIFGELDGIYHITGWNNVVENTLVIDGFTYVVLHDVFRTAFGDYIAFKLE